MRSIRFVLASFLRWCSVVAVQWQDRFAVRAGKRRGLQLESLEERQLLSANILDLDLMNTAQNTLGAEFSITVANGQYAALDLSAAGLYGYDCGNVVLTNKATGATTTLANDSTVTTSGVVYVQSGTYILTVASVNGGTSAAANIKIIQNDLAINTGGGNPALALLQDAATLQGQVKAGLAPVSAWTNFVARHQATIEATYGVGALKTDINTYWATTLDVNGDGKYDTTDRTIAQQASSSTTATNPVVTTIVPTSITPTNGTQLANTFKLSTTTPLAVATGTQTFVLGKISLDPNASVNWTCTSNTGSFTGAVYTIAADGTVSVTFSTLPPEGAGTLSFTIKGVDNTSGAAVLNQSATANYNVTRQNPSLVLDANSVTTTESGNANITFTVTDRDGEKLPTDSTWYTVTPPIVTVATGGNVTLTPAQLAAINVSVNQTNGTLTLDPASLSFLQAGDVLKLNVSVTATHSTTGKSETKSLVWTVNGEGVVTTFTPNTLLNSSITLGETQIAAGTEFLLGTLATNAPAAQSWTATTTLSGCTLRVDISGNVYATFTSLPPTNTALAFDIVANDAGGAAIAGSAQTISSAISLTVRAPLDIVFANTNDVTVTASGTTQIDFAVTDPNNANAVVTNSTVVPTVTVVGMTPVSLAGVVLADCFSVNAATGKLTFNSASLYGKLLDGESVTLSVTLTASDTWTTSAATQAVTFTAKENSPPILSSGANGGTASFTSGTEIATDDLLTNWTHGDSDEAGKTGLWTVSLTSSDVMLGGTKVGTASVGVNNEIVFTPDPVWWSSLACKTSTYVEIAYTVTDSHGDESAAASLTITVTPLHDSIELDITDIDIDADINLDAGAGEIVFAPTYAITETPDLAGKQFSYAFDTASGIVVTDAAGNDVSTTWAGIFSIDTTTGAITIDRDAAALLLSYGEAVDVTISVVATCDNCGEQSNAVDITLILQRDAFVLDDTAENSFTMTESAASLTIDILAGWAHGSSIDSTTWTLAFADTLNVDTGGVLSVFAADGTTLIGTATIDANKHIVFTPDSATLSLCRGEVAIGSIAYTVSDDHSGTPHISSEESFTVTITGEHADIALTVTTPSFSFDLNGPGTTGDATADPGYTVTGDENGIVYSIDSATVMISGEAVDVSAWLTIDAATGAVTIDRASILSIPSIAPGETLTVAVTIKAACAACKTENSDTIDLTFNLTRIDSFSLDDVACGDTILETQTTGTVVDLNTALADKIAPARAAGWLTWGDDATLDSVTADNLPAGLDLTGCFAFDNATGKLTFTPNGQFDFLALGEEAVLTFTVTATDAAYGVTHTATVTFTVTGETTLDFADDTANTTIVLDVDGLGDEFTIGTATSDAASITVTATIGGAAFNDFVFDDSTGVVTITFTKLPPTGANSVVFTITANDGDTTEPSIDHTVTVNVTRHEPVVAVTGTPSANETDTTTELAFTVADPNKEYIATDNWYTVSTMPTVSVAATSAITQAMLDAAGVNAASLSSLFAIDAAGKLTFAPNGALDFLALGEQLVFDVKFTVTHNDDASLATETNVVFTVTGETTLVFTKDATNETILLTVNELSNTFTIGNAITDSGTIGVSATITHGTTTTAFTDFAVDTSGNVTINFTKLPPSGENIVVFTITANNGSDELTTTSHTVTVNVTRLAPTVTVNATASGTETVGTNVAFTVADPNLEQTGNTWYSVSDPAVTLAASSPVTQAMLDAAGVNAASLFTIVNGEIVFTPNAALKFLAFGQQLVLDVAFTVTALDTDGVTPLATTKTVAFTITGETTLDFAADTTNGSDIALTVNELNAPFTIGTATTDSGSVVVTATLGDGTFTDFVATVDAATGVVTITFGSLPPTGANSVVFTITANDGSTNPFVTHTVTVNVMRLAPTVAVAGTPSANETGAPTELTIIVTDTNDEQTGNLWYSVSTPTVTIAASSAITQAMLTAAGVDINDLFTIVGDKLTFTPTAALQFLALGDKLVFDVSFTVADDTTGLSTPTKVTFTVNGEKTAPVANADFTITPNGGVTSFKVDSETRSNGFYTALGTSVDRGSSFAVCAITIGSDTYAVTPNVSNGGWTVNTQYGTFQYVTNNSQLRFTPSAAYYATLKNGDPDTLIVEFLIKDSNGEEAASTTKVTFNILGISEVPTIAANDTTLTTNESTDKSTTVTVTDPNGRTGTLVPTHSVAVSSGSLSMTQAQLDALFTLENGVLTFKPNGTLDTLATAVTLKVTISVTDSITGLPATPKDVTFTINPSVPMLATPHTAQTASSDATTIAFDKILADHWTHVNATELVGKAGWTVTLADSGKVYAMIGGTNTLIGTASFAGDKITFTPNAAITGLKCGEELSFSLSYTVKDSRGIESSAAAIAVTVTGAHDTNIAVTLDALSDTSWAFSTNDPALGTATVFTATNLVYAITGNEVGAYYALGTVAATGTTITDWSGIILVDRETGEVTINRAAFAELGIDDAAVILTVNVDATCRGDDDAIGTVELTFTISKFDSFAAGNSSGLTGAETSTGIPFDFAGSGVITDNVAGRTGIAWATFAAQLGSVTGDVASGTNWATKLGGCFAVDENGKFTFKPNKNFDFLAAGEEAVLTFTVTVTDAAYGVSHDATITITITGEVSAPTANTGVDLGIVTYGTPQTWSGIGATLGATVDQGGEFVLHAISIDGGATFVEFTSGVATFGVAGTSNHIGTFTYDSANDKLAFTPGAKFKDVSAGDGNPDTIDDSETLSIQFQLRNVADTVAAKLSAGNLDIEVEGINTPPEGVAPVGTAVVYKDFVVAGNKLTFAASEIATDINRNDKLSFFSVKGEEFFDAQGNPITITLGYEGVTLSLNDVGEIVIDTSGLVSRLTTPYTEDANGNPTGGINSYADVTITFVVKDNHGGFTDSFKITFLVKSAVPSVTGRMAASGDGSESMLLSMVLNDSLPPVAGDDDSFVEMNIAADQYRRHLDGATSDAIFRDGDPFAGDEQWHIAKRRTIGSRLHKHESDAVFAGKFDMLDAGL